MMDFIHNGPFVGVYPTLLVIVFWLTACALVIDLKKAD